MEIPYLRLLAAGLLAIELVGCVAVSRPIVACPLTYSEQEKEILTVVPKGITREEALRRLTAAGVEGSYGISRRVYYCDLWKRPNGERWHINVALLFDDRGRLYKTQMAEADITAVPEGKSPSGKEQAEGPSSKPASDFSDTTSSSRTN
jgi:hypothetical protein